MHSKASSSDEEEADCVDGVLPEVPEEEEEEGGAAQQEIVVSEFSYEPIRRPDPARPHARGLYFLNSCYIVFM